MDNRELSLMDLFEIINQVNHKDVDTSSTQEEKTSEYSPFRFKSNQYGVCPCCGSTNITITATDEDCDVIYESFNCKQCGKNGVFYFTCKYEGVDVCLGDENYTVEDDDINAETNPHLCPFNCDNSDDCKSCEYGCTSHFQDGECVRR